MVDENTCIFNTLDFESQNYNSSIGEDCDVYSNGGVIEYRNMSALYDICNIYPPNSLRAMSCLYEQPELKHQTAIVPTNLDIQYEMDINYYDKANTILEPHKTSISPTILHYDSDPYYSDSPNTINNKILQLKNNISESVEEDEISDKKKEKEFVE